MNVLKGHCISYDKEKCLEILHALDIGLRRFNLRKLHTKRYIFQLILEPRYELHTYSSLFSSDAKVW